MSDAAAGAAFVVEQVLLYDASLLIIGRKRVAAAEFLINESLGGYAEFSEFVMK